MAQLMKKLMRGNSRVPGSRPSAREEAEAAAEPREFLYRIKPPQNSATMTMPFPDSMMGDLRRSHPRTREGNAARVRLFDVFDCDEYKDLRYAYTYNFRDA